MADTTMRRAPLIAGNWKMNETTAQAVTLSQHVSYETDKTWGSIDVVLCPPFTDLKSVFNVLAFDHSSIMLGAQDVFWEPDGAYTGAISVSMLKELTCEYCIVGHSERREYFGETDEMVNKKVKALCAQGIHPIMCCGEPLEVRDGGDALAYIGEQVKRGWDGADPEDVASSVIAYEPVWAIGTGRAATPEQAQEACVHIRGVIAEMFGNEVADRTRILYGGSMNQGNAEMFLKLPDVDGGLIGSASLDAKAFAQIVQTAIANA